MSHFVAFVIVPPDVPNIEAAVWNLLAPYDENIEVDEYEIGCYCLGNLAHRAGTETADNEIGTFDRLRDQYWALPEAERPEWDVYKAPYQTVVDRVARAHPLYQKPDPNCKDCHGTGLRLTTYNPNSQWDWWKIGGRWNDFVSESNITPVAQTLQKAVTPYAVVTPDGVWHAQGQMGWWGMSSDDQSDSDWAQAVHDLLSTYPEDYHVVTCDLHI